MEMISKSKNKHDRSCQNYCQIDWLHKNQWQEYDTILYVALTFYPAFCSTCAALTMGCVEVGLYQDIEIFFNVD